MNANQELTARTNEECCVCLAKIEMHFWFPCVMVSMEFCSYSSISAEMVDKTRRGAVLGRRLASLKLAASSFLKDDRCTWTGAAAGSSAERQ